MANSPLPAGTKIRVLTTIEDGVATHETITDDKLFGSLDDFLLVGHQQGFFITHKAAELDVKKIRGGIERALRVVDELIKDFPENDTSDECMALCEIDEEIRDIRHHLNKIFTEE
jgi:hypothetical protein